MVTVNIPLDNETAKIYEKAPQADKKKMQILMSLWLREFEKPSISLDELMDDVSRKAQRVFLNSFLYTDKRGIHGKNKKNPCCP